jgi:hypothetical protein
VNRSVGWQGLTLSSECLEVSSKHGETSTLEYAGGLGSSVLDLDAPDIFVQYSL